GRPMSREALLRILNRELSAALRRSRVALSGDVDQVIKCSAEVVDDLPDHYARPGTQRIYDGWIWPPVETLDLLRVYLCQDTVFAQLADLPDQPFEIRQVFACPLVSEK